jgi:hypothetical protein
MIVLPEMNMDVCQSSLGLRHRESNATRRFREFPVIPSALVPRNDKHTVAKPSLAFDVCIAYDLRPARRLHLEILAKALRRAADHVFP